MIDSQYFYLNVIVLIIGTLVIRGGFIAFSSRIKISAKVRELFTYIPASILPGLIVPVSFFQQGQIDWISGKERFFVLVLATVFCYFIRNTLAVISFGLVTLYLLSQA